MFSLHFNLCNPAINNRGVSVGKWKLFARSREDIADIRNYHAGNYCIPVFTSCILMQRNFFPEIFFEFSLGHAVKPVTAHLTTFIIISMFIRVITKKIQIFTKEQEFTANPNQNLPSRHFLLGIGSGQVFHQKDLPDGQWQQDPHMRNVFSNLLSLVVGSGAAWRLWWRPSLGCHWENMQIKDAYHQLSQSGYTTDLLVTCLPWLL